MDYPISDPTARLHPATDKFTDGDPVGGIPASRDSADYQNMVFDEILAVIQLAGLTPDEADLTQLWEAIDSIAAAHAAGVAIAEASSAEALAGSAVAKFTPPDLVHKAFKQFGLGTEGDPRTSPEDPDLITKAGFYVLTGATVNMPSTHPFVLQHYDWDGILTTAVQVAISVGATANVEAYVRAKSGGVWTDWLKLFHDQNGGADSGVDADLVRGLPADFTSNLSGNGYQVLPSGLIIQWGITPSVAPNGQTTVTLPVTFPTTILSVSASPIQTNSLAGSVTTYWDQASSNNSSIVLGIDSDGSGSTVDSRPLSWISIGY